MLVGLVGQNIQRSRTPGMHEAEGARIGLRYTYKLIDTAKIASTPQIDEILRAAAICGFAGLNVTYPFKQTIIPFLDALDEDAARVGAVNTVVFRDGKAIGYNTDLWGFAEGFRRDMASAALGRVLQVGAGGAGSAVANALVQSGVAHLTLADVDHRRASDLADRLSAGNPGVEVSVSPIETIADYAFDGIVNTTPVGMDKTPGMPVPQAMLRPETWIADIIYFPLQTELLRAATAAGCRTFSGAAMAVFQAVRAFELFTGRAADSDAMTATFNAFNADETEPAPRTLT